MRQGREGKGKTCPKLFLLPPFDLLLYLQLAQLNRRPESKGSQVVQSIEISLLGRVGDGSRWEPEESQHVPILFVSDSFFKWREAAVANFILLPTTQINHGACYFLTLVYSSVFLHSMAYCFLYVLYLNSSRKNLVVSLSSIGQSAHRTAYKTCFWVTCLSLVQLATMQAGLWWTLSQKRLWVVDFSEETVWLEATFHVQYIVTPTSTPRWPSSLVKDNNINIQLLEGQANAHC